MRNSLPVTRHHAEYFPATKRPNAFFGDKNNQSATPAAGAPIGGGAPARFLQGIDAKMAAPEGQPGG